MKDMGQKKVVKTKYKLILLLLLLFFVGNLGIKQTEAAKIMKVGYFDENGFIKEENGTFRGYTVEYLKKIAEYTGWKYEFVRYDTWGECIEKLESGELDLFCPMIYSEKRAEKLAFTDTPVGYASTILYAREDSDIYYGDTTQISGKKIGIAPGSAQSEHFFEYAEENHIVDYEEVHFHAEDKMMEALDSGEIDVAVLGSLAYHKNVRIVGRFGEEPLYCVSRKENQDIINQVSEVIDKIQIDTPGFVSQLEEKYYGDNMISDNPLFTRDEMAYIAQSEPIQILLRDEFTPINYVEDGQPAGILVEYLNLVSEKSGLEFEYLTKVFSAELKDSIPTWIKDNVLVVSSQRAYESEELTEEISATGTLMNVGYSYVMREDEEIPDASEVCSIATTYGMVYLEDILKAEGINYQIQYYNTPEACMEAVYKREADVTMLYNYMVGYWLQKPKYEEKLVEIVGESLKNDICILGSSEDQMLMSILNKTIHYISVQEREEIITREMLGKTYENSIMDSMYEYRILLIGIAILLVMLAVVYAIIMKQFSEIKVERKKAELERQKYSLDEVTQIFNRNTFFEKARQMVDVATEDMCIVIMDITNFKVVNDLYGMKNGDRLLRQMADELKQRCQGYEVVLGRFSGDHFYMCMSSADFKKLNLPKRYNTFLTEMDIKVTYGVFEIGEKTETPINIMCDRASLAAHSKGRKEIDYICYYSDEEREKILREQEIANDMEKALEERQFCVYIQPKYDVYAERIIGGEALVRWKHPQKGMIPPINFIGVFEKNGFIIRLDYYVWEETCRMISEMKKTGISGYPISINVSRAHFYGTELKSKLLYLIQKYNLEPQDLELEITETICAEDTDTIYKLVKELQNEGFSVAMDDFGSGYSSLNMLKEMPLNVIKMDLKFLDSGEDTYKSHSILETLIELAKNLGLVVVVEGVETQAQVDFLRRVGNACAQGYFFSKPVEWTIYENMVAQQ